LAGKGTAGAEGPSDGSSHKIWLWVEGEKALTVSGKVFADGMYEGDLMAAAEVKTQIGRESIADPRVGADRLGLAARPQSRAGEADCAPQRAFRYDRALTAPIEQLVLVPPPNAIDKPDPAPLQLAARYLRLKPNALVLVGDAMDDMTMARRADATAIGVLTGAAERGRLRKAGAHWVADTVPTVVRAAGRV